MVGLWLVLLTNHALQHLTAKSGNLIEKDHHHEEMLISPLVGIGVSE